MTTRATHARGFLETTVGLKITMGVTGVALTAFVIGHVLGNLLVFAGRAQMNRYSVLLHASPELLWSVRAVLFSSVVLHAWAAWSLTRIAHAARPLAYSKKVPRTATWASRSMRWGGLSIAGFIIVHVLHLTVGALRPAPFSETDVYGNVVGAFHVPWVVSFYLAAMLALGLHLFHGAWALFRSTGMSRPSADPRRRPIVTIVALCVWAGFTSIPVAVFLGWVR